MHTHVAAMLFTKDFWSTCLTPAASEKERVEIIDRYDERSKVQIRIPSRRGQRIITRLSDKITLGSCFVS